MGAASEMVWPWPVMHAGFAALMALEAPGTMPPTGGRKPVLPKSFHATADMWESEDDPVCSFTATGSCEGVPWSLSQDDDRKVYATAFDVRNAYAPAAFSGEAREWYNLTVVSTADGSNTIMNDLCYAGGAADTPQKYTNFFGWVPLASFRGNATIEGRACEVWGLKALGVDVLLAVDAADGVPVQYNYSKAGYAVSFTFTTFAAGAGAFPDLSDCASPPTCAEPGYERGDTVERDVFLFHPAHEFNVSDQNVGDAGGDAFFVCEDLLTGRNPGVDHAYARLSRWSLNYTATVGQYQNCNGYGAASACLGSNVGLVGREAALGLGSPLAGQCETNDLAGTWWSLPAAGRCADGAQPAPGACSWAATRVKTIDGDCLISARGFNATCAEGRRAPFADARAVFDRAFASDDPAEGGCPPVVAPASP